MQQIPMIAGVSSVEQFLIMGILTWLNVWCPFLKHLQLIPVLCTFEKVETTRSNSQHNRLHNFYWTKWWSDCGERRCIYISNDEGTTPVCYDTLGTKVSNPSNDVFVKVVSSNVSTIIFLNNQHYQCAILKVKIWFW